MENNLITEYQVIDGSAIVDREFNIIMADEQVFRFIGVGLSMYTSIVDITVSYTHLTLPTNREV
mgnify:CR=1 FL=1